MAFDLPEFIPGLKTAADLSGANLYSAAVLDAAGDVVEASAAGVIVIGSIYSRPSAAGLPVQVATRFAKCRAGGAINEGDIIETNASGDFIALAPAVGELSHGAGIALTAASGAGAVFTALLHPLPTINAAVS